MDLFYVFNGRSVELLEGSRLLGLTRCQGKTEAVDSPPKRPASSYILWLNDNRAAIVKKVGNDVSAVGKAAKKSSA